MLFKMMASAKPSQTTNLHQFALVHGCGKHAVDGVWTVWATFSNQTQIISSVQFPGQLVPADTLQADAVITDFEAMLVP